MHHPGDLDDVLVEQPERVGVGEHERRDVVVELRLERLQVDPSAGVDWARTRGSKPATTAVAGIGAVGRVGDEHLARLAPLRLVVGADQQQAGELAVGAGRRLQRARLRPAISASHPSSS